MLSLYLMLLIGFELRLHVNLVLLALQLVWEYKQNLTKDDRFESGANEVCKKVFEEVSGFEIC